MNKRWNAMTFMKFAFASHYATFRSAEGSDPGIVYLQTIGIHSDRMIYNLEGCVAHRTRTSKSAMMIRPSLVFSRDCHMHQMLSALRSVEVHSWQVLWNGQSYRKATPKCDSCVEIYEKIAPIEQSPIFLVVHRADGFSQLSPKFFKCARRHSPGWSGVRIW